MLLDCFVVTEFVWSSRYRDSSSQSASLVLPSFTHLSSILTTGLIPVLGLLPIAERRPPMLFLPVKLVPSWFP